MTGRTSPTIVVDEVLGARADDPRFARIDVRMPGNIEAVIALHVSQIDELIRALIAAKGYFDWPPPSQDQHHRVSEVEVAAGERLVAFRVVALTPLARQKRHDHKWGRRIHPRQLLGVIGSSFLRAVLALAPLRASA